MMTLRLRFLKQNLLPLKHLTERRKRIVSWMTMMKLAWLLKKTKSAFPKKQLKMSACQKKQIKMSAYPPLTIRVLGHIRYGVQLVSSWLPFVRRVLGHIRRELRYHAFVSSSHTLNVQMVVPTPEPPRAKQSKTHSLTADNL